MFKSIPRLNYYGLHKNDVKVKSNAPRLAGGEEKLHIFFQTKSRRFVFLTNYLILIRNIVNFIILFWRILEEIGAAPAPPPPAAPIARDYQ
jgi:hypothetical protein